MKIYLEVWKIRARQLVIGSLFLSCMPKIMAALPIRGSISATASYSDEFNYLGQTRESLNLNLVDVILNSTHRFENGLRVGGQIYAYSIGDYRDITLDFANLDYSFTQSFGVRLGRNKLSLGLYNDAQDLDSIRTFASLPITFYPKTLRAITNSFDGISVYGNVGMGKAGSLDYQVYWGMKEDPKGDAPFLKGTSNLSQYEKWDVVDGVYGTSLFWNVPLDGLKIGYSYARFPENSLPGHLGYSKDMRGFALGLVATVDGFMGPGAWDKSGRFAGTSASTTGIDVDFRVISAEYNRGKWLCSAEYKLIDLTDGINNIPAFAMIGQPAVSAYTAFIEEYYVMASYQATEKIGLGAYYAYEDTNRHGATTSSNTSKDYCAAISYTPVDWMICKFELHHVDGLSFVNSAGDDNRKSSATETKWNYVALKTTISF